MGTFEYIQYAIEALKYMASRETIIGRIYTLCTVAIRYSPTSWIRLFEVRFKKEIETRLESSRGNLQAQSASRAFVSSNIRNMRPTRSSSVFLILTTRTFR